MGVALLCAIWVPLIATNYRRYGKLSPTRLLTFAAFTIYSVAILTYTMLPLPEIGSYECVSAAFRPFTSFESISEFDTSTPRAWLTNPAVLQIVFNLLLFMPLGVLARMLWGRGVIFSTVLGLGVSLFVETSQLTGLWWLYPCAYRLFDVDDLWVNTLGAFVGAVFALILRLREVGPRDGLGPRPVTAGRRLLGMLADAAVIGFVSVAVQIGVRAYSLYFAGIPATELEATSGEFAAWTAAFGVQLVSVLVSGRTIGDLVINVRYAPGRVPQVLARPLRLLGGIGGYSLFTAPFAAELGIGWLAPIFAVVLVVMVLATHDRSGLAGRLSGQRVEDAFSGAPSSGAQRA